LAQPASRLAPGRAAPLARRVIVGKNGGVEVRPTIRRCRLTDEPHRPGDSSIGRGLPEPHHRAGPARVYKRAPSVRRALADQLERPGARTHRAGRRCARPGSSARSDFPPKIEAAPPSEDVSTARARSPRRSRSPTTESVVPARQWDQDLLFRLRLQRASAHGRRSQTRRRRRASRFPAERKWSSHTDPPSPVPHGSVSGASYVSRAAGRGRGQRLQGSRPARVQGVERGPGEPDRTARPPGPRHPETGSAGTRKERLATRRPVGGAGPVRFTSRL